MSSDPPELGPERRGPDFAPPSSGRPEWPVGSGYQPQGPVPHRQPAGGPYQAPPRPEPPPRDRRPAIITAAIVGVVVLIVVIASVRAFRSDDRIVRDQTSPSPTPSASAAPSDDPNSISFTSREGSGRLTLVSHTWTTDGQRAPAYGQFLQLDLKITATDGRVSYGPQYFQTFDASGNLFQTTEVGARPPLLGDGYLHAGESVSGGIAFDMPRGAVTLLMSNSLLESVTALRIVD